MFRSFNRVPLVIKNIPKQNFARNSGFQRKQGREPIVKPIFYTVLRCGAFTFFTVNGIFALTTVWEFESKKRQILDIHFDRFISTEKQSMLLELFSGIAGRPAREADVFWLIFAINSVVFLMNMSGRVNVLALFRSTPFGPYPVVSQLFSIFSHETFLHFAINMYVLHNFTYPIVSMIGKEQFLAMFISGGLCASFLSTFSKAALKIPIPSVGSSGGIACLVAYFCLMQPAARLQIPIISEIIPHSFKAESAIKGMLALETIGAIFLMNISRIDHAAHLGGLLFGIYYNYWGYKTYEQRRRYIIRWWHYLRYGKNDK